MSSSCLCLTDWSPLVVDMTLVVCMAFTFMHKQGKEKLSVGGKDAGWVKSIVSEQSFKIIMGLILLLVFVFADILPIAKVYWSSIQFFHIIAAIIVGILMVVYVISLWRGTYIGQTGAVSRFKFEWHHFYIIAFALTVVSLVLHIQFAIADRKEDDSAASAVHLA